jgi:hypothetical protein
MIKGRRSPFGVQSKTQMNRKQKRHNRLKKKNKVIRPYSTKNKLKKRLHRRNSICLKPTISRIKKNILFFLKKEKVIKRKIGKRKKGWRGYPCLEWDEI